MSSKVALLVVHLFFRLQSQFPVLLPHPHSHPGAAIPRHRATSPHSIVDAIARDGEVQCARGVDVVMTPPSGECVCLRNIKTLSENRRHHDQSGVNDALRTDVLVVRRRKSGSCHRLQGCGCNLFTLHHAIRERDSSSVIISMWGKTKRLRLSHQTLSRVREMRSSRGVCSKQQGREPLCSICWLASALHVPSLEQA